MDALQRVSYQEPTKEKLPMPGFATISLDAHATRYYQEKVAQFEYLSDDITSAQTILDRIVSFATTFVSPENCQDIPVQLSINRAPNKPYEWNVSYLFPSDIDWENSGENEIMSKVFRIEKSNSGIYRSSFSITAQAQRWGKNSEFLGVFYGVPQISCTVSSYVLQDPENIKFDTYDLPLNDNVTQVSISISKDTNNIKVYEYTMTSALRVD